MYDGGGIDPDVHVSAGMLSPITVNLYLRFYIFDFATEFVQKHDSIPPPEKFEITEDILNAFHKYIKAKDFNYDTESEAKLSDLIKTAKKEKYYNRAKTDFEALRKSLNHNIDTDFYTHKAEISDLLKQEIVGRYYYQAGRIKSSLAHDSVLIKAEKSLTHPDEYTGILSGEKVLSLK